MITPSGGLWRLGCPVLVNHTLMILSSPVRTADETDSPESWGSGMMNAFPSTTENQEKEIFQNQSQGEKKRWTIILNTLILTVKQ